MGKYDFFEKRCSDMVVLGVDPGYAIVGWGVIETNGNSYLPKAFGAITTDAGIDFNLRLEMIYNDMITILKKAKPDAVAIEKLYFTTNVTTASSSYIGCEVEFFDCDSIRFSFFKNSDHIVIDHFKSQIKINACIGSNSSKRFW